MKKTLFIAAISVIFAACGEQNVVSSNLTQVSEFSIVTTDKDTLYLKEGDEMSIYLKNHWDNGAFRNYDSGINISVIMVNEETFNTLSGKSIKDPIVVQRLSKLTEGY